MGKRETGLVFKIKWFPSNFKTNTKRHLLSSYWVSGSMSGMWSNSDSLSIEGLPWPPRSPEPRVIGSNSPEMHLGGLGQDPRCGLSKEACLNHSSPLFSLGHLR